MNDTTSRDDAPEAAPVAPPKVRMDRSRAYSTVHGERHPGDPIAQVHFFQDGVPADASGHFIFDHPIMNTPGEEGDKIRAAAARKLKRAIAQAAKNPQRPAAAKDDDADENADVDADDDADDENELEPVNLEAWLRGEQEVEWGDVTQELARRFKVRKSKIEDAVEFLVKEGVVPKGQLRKKFQKMLD